MIPSVRKEALIEALDRFDNEMRDGMEAQNWRTNPKYKYAISYAGKLYPVKKVITLATGALLSDFSGGERRANKYARDRGLQVVHLRPRNPSWTRDELILALELYQRHRGSPPGPAHPDVIALSQVLNALASQLTHGATETYRNPNGDAMKLMNFRALDPEYTRTGKVGMRNGNSDEQRVWGLFGHDDATLRTIADGIRLVVAKPEFAASGADRSEDEDDAEAEEGAILTRVHRYRERDRSLVAKKKKAMLKHHGRLACEACEFTFTAAYGERGDGFIEVHHAKPVHALSPGDKTTLGDLRLVCSNCHRMIHRRRPWLEIDALRLLLTKAPVPS